MPSTRAGFGKFYFRPEQYWRIKLSNVMILRQDSHFINLAGLDHYFLPFCSGKKKVQNNEGPTKTIKVRKRKTFLK